MSFLPQHERFLGLDDEWADPDQAECVVASVPFERTSSYGMGSARGPAAIIAASQQVELFDTELGFSPYETCGGVLTAKPLNVDGLTAPVLFERLRADVSAWIKDARFVVTLGGEHSSVVGAVVAHCDAFDDLTVLQFDAHADLREEYEGDPWSHACAMARVRDRHERLVQVGVRSEAVEEFETRRTNEIPFFGAERIHEQDRRGEDWIASILDALSSQVYLSFDCDVFDPSVMPATGTPEPNGLTWRQVDRLLEAIIRRRELVGMDVSELAPVKGFRHSEYAAAKLIYRTIGRVFHSETKDAHGRGVRQRPNFE